MKKTNKSLIESREIIRGIIKRIYYSRDGWTAGIIETENKEIKFSGNIVTSIDAPVVFSGGWKTHPKFGLQFEASSVQLDKAMSVHGLARYLANSPSFVGIGEARAYQIAESFGSNFEKVLLENPQKIADIAKCPIATVLVLQKAWIENDGINAIMAALAAYELTWYQAKSIYEAYGAEAVAMLETNPYVIVKQISGFGFKRVDAIALRAGFKKDNPNRIEAGVRDVIATALDSGHTWTEWREVLKLANELLIMDVIDSKQIIDKALSRLTSRLGDTTLAEIRDGGSRRVGFSWIYSAEVELAETLSHGGKFRPIIEDLRIATVQEFSPSLNDGQIHAVFVAFASCISVITGAAGVGKTFAIKTICDLAERAELSVQLCATTGKAAKRMEEATGRSAATMHRLIGYRGESNLLDIEPQRIGADIIIIDEMSMCDVPLAVAFMRCIDLAEQTVVFVGDHNQLPPVGCGSVLRDIIGTECVPVTRLEVVMRQAGTLKANSTAILDGIVRPTEKKPEDGEVADWYVFAHFAEPYQIQAFIKKVLMERIPEPLNFDLLRDVQVLTPTHKGDAGTVALNAMIQEFVQAKLYGIEVSPPANPAKRSRPLPGDKCIQMKNDYLLGLMNGTIGILRLEEGQYILEVEELLACGDMGIARYEISDEKMPNLQLAYALTIHKSQGSEFPLVITVCSKAHSFMTHRNLLYTAVTRASRMSVIVGDSWALRTCVAKVDAGLRRTFLPFLIEHSRQATERQGAGEPLSGEEIVTIAFDKFEIEEVF